MSSPIVDERNLESKIEELEIIIKKTTITQPKVQIPEDLLKRLELLEHKIINPTELPSNILERIDILEHYE